MKIRILLFSIVILASFHTLYAQSQADDFAKNIKASALKSHIYVLASDSCDGRNIGTNGIVIARDYIEDHLRKDSILKPFFNHSYLQPFQLIKNSSKTEEVKVKGQALTSFDDYIYSGLYDGYSKEIHIVYGGKGTEEELQGLDLNGKGVFLLNDNLRAAFKSSKIAYKYGAELSIIANPKNINQFESLSRQMKEFVSFSGYHLLNDTLKSSYYKGGPDHRFLTISNQMVKKLTSRNIQYWNRNKANDDHTIGTISIRVDKQRHDTVMAHNIISCIPGINSDEMIVIGAHYDHLGVMHDKIYYGADDNASGTAALIELANAFAKAYRYGYRPMKSIVFIAFAAEEGGLCGSEFFVDQIKNPEQIKLMVNIDMIGRPDTKHIDESGYFYFINNGLSDSVISRNNELCKKYLLTPDYSSDIDASDHKSFKNVGIPTIFFFDGINTDLHKTTDTPDRLNYKRMERITRLIFETVWENASIDNEQVFNNTGPK